MAEYWNHNAAYHRWVLRQAAGRARVLDVGCGEGLLIQRLAAGGRQVVGIEPDDVTMARAEHRVAALPQVQVMHSDFETFTSGQNFDLIVFLTTIHHMDLRTGLIRARQLLRAGGRLLVVGVAKNASALDWVVDVARLVPARVAGWARRETETGVPAAEPVHSLAQIRAVAAEEIPGATVRRGLYYRYLLRWDRPGESG